MTGPASTGLDDDEDYHRLRRIHEQQLQIREERERAQQVSFDERMALLNKMEELEAERRQAKRIKAAANATTGVTVHSRDAPRDAAQVPQHQRPREMLPPMASTPPQEMVGVQPTASMNQQLRNVLHQVKAKNGAQLGNEQGKPPLTKPPRVPLEGTVGAPYFPVTNLRHEGGKGIYAADATKSTHEANEQREPSLALHEKVENNGRALHPQFPSLIRLQCGDYIELRCYVCGGNHSRKHADGTFISGLQGFQRHLSSAHGKGQTFEEVLHHCAHKRLRPMEVLAMLTESPEAYRIEQVIVAAAEPGTSVKKPRQRQTFKRAPGVHKATPVKRKLTQMQVQAPKPRLMFDIVRDDAEAEEKHGENEGWKANTEPVTEKRAGTGQGGDVSDKA